MCRRRTQAARGAGAIACAMMMLMDDRLLALLQRLHDNPPLPGKDCSEIAEDFAAVAPGRILRARPANTRMMLVPEYGVWAAFEYHEVYVHGGKVFDPRYSGSPMPEWRYRRMVAERNPGVVITWS